MEVFLNLTNVSGIYCLYFETDDGAYYIGKSTNIKARYSAHCSKLSCNTHPNDKLRAAYQQYKKLPSIHVLEVCVDLEASRREIFWIKEFEAYTSGYNNSLGGEGYSGEYSSLCLNSRDEYVEVFLYIYNNPTASLISVHNKFPHISYDTVRDMAVGRTHSWLSEHYPEEYISVTTRRRSSAIYDKDKYVLVLKLLAENRLNMREISNACEVGYNLVRNIACGSSHKYLKDEYPELYAKMKGNKRGNGSSKFLTK
jgi:predicted GIY-YIG superfamily endonuclease